AVRTGRDEDRPGSAAGPIWPAGVEVQTSPTSPAKLLMLTQGFRAAQGRKAKMIVTTYLENPPLSGGFSRYKIVVLLDPHRQSPVHSALTKPASGITSTLRARV